MQWTSHCVPWQIDFVGVLFGLWPRFLLFLVLCCLLRCFRWRNASLAGGFAGRRVWLVSVVFVCCINRFACSNGHGMSLYKRLSYSLCSCKDRAFSATSATHEEKKSSVSRQNHRGWACSAASCGTTRQVSVHKPWQAQYFKRKHGHPTA